MTRRIILARRGTELFPVREDELLIWQERGYTLLDLDAPWGAGSPPPPSPLTNPNVELYGHWRGAGRAALLVTAAATAAALTAVLVNLALQLLRGPC